MELGRLLYLPEEAARKVQNMEKILALDTPGSVKFILIPALPPPLLHMLQLLPRFLLLPQQKLCVSWNLFLFL